jgi:prepilin-type N-terminal cleavage/methylation domain-containing protein
MRAIGMTLVELLVVVTMLGILASVVAFGARPRPSSEAPLERLRRRAAMRAVDTGARISIGGESLLVRVLPDGRVLSPGIDPVVAVPR